MSSAPARTALVTGAGGAIGNAIALRLALQGNCNVCVLDLDAQAVDRVAQGINEKGGRAGAYVADLSDQQSLQSVCEAITSAHGAVDILVNNAAIAAMFAIEDYPEAHWHKTMAVNLTAPFLLAKHFLPGMRAKRWGRIINISSINGLRAGSGRLAYGTSKTALIGLTRQLAIDLAQWGITVNALAPGAIASPLLEAMASGSKQRKEHLLDLVPMNRFGTPEEVASAAAFLASTDAAYITGQTLAIDGGFAAAGILARSRNERA